MTGLDSLRHRMASLPEGRLLVGLSGGADSVALLLATLGRERTDVFAVHVNHGLRGAESEEDEAFVRQLCRNYKVPLIVRRVFLRGKRSESAARGARFEAFRAAMAETGADALLLAHNRDDRAETYLMRLLRGSGPDGLACMPESDERLGFLLLRPLLSLGREEIREALSADGISWREDSSNEDESYFRNAVRRKLLPLLDQLAPGAPERIAHAAFLTGQDCEVLNTMTVQALEGWEKRSFLPASLLLSQPSAIRGRMLRRWWKCQGPVLKEHELSSFETEALLSLTEGERKTVNLPGGFRCVRGRSLLHLVPPQRPVFEPTPWREPETALAGIILRKEPSGGSPGNGITCQEVPEGFPEGCILRTRQPGDRIRPFGSPGHRKLQDYFTDRRVDEPFRDRIPLLCRGSEVLLAAGVGAGAIPPWDPSVSNIRLVWEGEMPWAKL